jgi:hypothetical protein
MMQWIARITTASMARIVAGLALVVACLVMFPAGPASASSMVVGIWSDQTDDALVPCGSPGTYTYGSKALEVYNPCGDRVWLHYYDNANGQVYTFCVNPGGGLAYGFSYPFTDLQLTSNPSPCYASNAQFEIAWWNGSNIPTFYTFACNPGQAFTNIAGGPGRGNWVLAVWNDESATNQGPGTCNFRIWVHQTDSGTGQSACMDPGSTLPPGLPFPGVLNGGGYQTPVYWQVQETYNQAPCSAGGPPYPY